MPNEKGRFVIEDYNKKPTFASFLPAICGQNGVPMWCFYVNRGQCICSLGSGDKEHSVMEFYPAVYAYRNTALCGFRTFLRIDGRFCEAFAQNHGKSDMFIEKNRLEIQWTASDLDISVSVVYYLMPEERTGGIVRSVKVKSLSGNSHTVEILDGCPAVIPYGIELYKLKYCGQTMCAWMNTERTKDGFLYFTAKGDTRDAAMVGQSDNSGSYYFAYDSNGTPLQTIADSQMIFGSDTSFITPTVFAHGGIWEVLSQFQRMENCMPCAFSGASFTVSQKPYGFTSVMGRAISPDKAWELAKKCSNSAFLEQKNMRAIELTENLCSAIKTKTANPVFDRYCAVTFMDNVLRGGAPLLFGDNIFYIYSRKHGDTERDYNDFFVSPEYYSQGNANFRDLNQNRRNDVRFYPFVGDYNIKLFWNLTTIDGLNPLHINRVYFKALPSAEDAAKKYVSREKLPILQKFLQKPFTPGSLALLCEDEQLCDRPEALVREIVICSQSTVSANFGEGYWSDHFSYNLDLIESYLSVWCDREKELLIDDCTYTFFVTGVNILPRTLRYSFDSASGFVRQYDSISKTENAHSDVLKTQSGQTVKVNLLVKILSLAVCKLAAMDSMAIGVEMFGGKPGWNDALNGLPGHFGSSTCEVCELYRLVAFALDIIKKHSPVLSMPAELYDLIMEIDKATKDAQPTRDSLFIRWDRANAAMEEFRARTENNLSGKSVLIQAAQAEEILTRWKVFVLDSISRAAKMTQDVFPTYFSYEMTRYEKQNGQIIPQVFEVSTLPPFLEGEVHYLKTDLDIQSKQQVYKRVKRSGLFDKKLKMYKLNDSLSALPLSVGRARAFTPGWLENESIWLHMEYKYLLQLLKSEMYMEFFDDTQNMLVPFLNPDIYGRSILENSTFIVGSANPDHTVHGRGFVARLTGATAEFLSMWSIMMFGKNPFNMERENLTLTLSPAIPMYLIDGKLTVSAVFLGRVMVNYHFDRRDNFFPGSYNITKYSVNYSGQDSVIINGNCIQGKTARDIRDGLAHSIDVWLIKK